MEANGGLFRAKWTKRKEKKLTIRQMKKIHYNFEKKSFYGCEKNRPIMVFLQNESVLLFLPVSSRKKRLSVRLQKSTKTHLTDKKPKSKRKGRGKIVSILLTKWK